MNLENEIKEWVILDNKLKILNEQAKHLRDERSKITRGIEQYINTESLLNASVDITGGKLKFTETKSTGPLSLKFIEQCLGEIISNKSQLDIIVNHIKKKREEKSKTDFDIKRYYHN